ncbi:bifunctional acetate--CoA ligase family protein/GNAT family N-acetyltransferase [Vibrio profundum]|uniref:bifunctional acetate--CoA ligase family protein/GNAT family N-acetyltransferase n=1 Tax=Vibrio profundum TaxID=2910247 RepID=UPI003D0F144C
MNQLSHFFNPKSVAVIGASTKPCKPGNVLVSNLLRGGFDGVVMPVSPKYQSVCGILTYPSISELPLEPDIAVLCTPAHANLALFKQLTERNTKNVVVLSAYMDIEKTDAERATEVSLSQQCLKVAQRAGMRVLGPSSLGLILPWIGLNASFSPVNAKQGNIAFISQSASVCTTILDWAQENQVGFSAFVSLGETSDMSFSDMLDWFATDPKTEAIMLYVDSIDDARQFLSSARAASRYRRVLVLKAGISPLAQSTRASSGNSEALDVIFDSAIRRAGMLRVNTTHEMFAAAKTLNHSITAGRERITIITNAHGPSIIALDALDKLGGRLANIDQALSNQLINIFPNTFKGTSPIDLAGDATPERYKKVLEAVLESDISDTILIIHAPSAFSSSEDTAKMIVDTIHSHPRRARFNILTNWCGESSAKDSRQIFNRAGLPTYRTPESAITAFIHLVDYSRNQKQLLETPSTAEKISSEGFDAARRWLKEQVGDQTQRDLDIHQLCDFLSNCGFQVKETWLAHDAEQAVSIADTLGYPVAVKLRSPDITHKSTVHGVMLNLMNNIDVRQACNMILNRIKHTHPNAKIDGLLVQSMALTSGADEIRIKVKNDATFGPTILLGQGGTEWDETQDAEAALPPLNMALSRYQIIRAIKNRRIKSKNPSTPIDIIALSKVLVRISQMIIELPQIKELDIHPLLARGAHFTVLDAHITLQPYHGESHRRLSIRPYPAELEQQVTLRDHNSVMLRPIRPEDEPMHTEFIGRVSEDDLYKRFFAHIHHFNHEAIAKLTHIDYDREMAFIAVSKCEKRPAILGVSRVVVDVNFESAEFAILIRSDLNNQGLGKILMIKLIQYCQMKGIIRLVGETMPSNQGMLSLAKKLGFELDVDFSEGTANMVLNIEPPV